MKHIDPFADYDRGKQKLHHFMVRKHNPKLYKNGSLLTCTAFISCFYTIKDRLFDSSKFKPQFLHKRLSKMLELILSAVQV